MRDRYLENIELETEANPGYLGLLHFKGIGFFEWKYEGQQLTEPEVWQLVDCIQDYHAGKATTTERGILTQSSNAPQDIDFCFRYGKTSAPIISSSKKWKAIYRANQRGAYSAN
jgi:hypothetical protein